MVTWKDWAFKKKNKVLLTAAFVFLLFVYWISLSNTAELYFQNEELRKKVNLSYSAPQMISQLEKQLLYWDKVANNESDTASTIQNELFMRVSKACDKHQAVLRSLELSGSEQKDSYSIDTYLVVVEGGYKNLLQTVHQLENQLGNGILSSLAFEVETDRYTKKSYLRAKLYIQSVK